MIEAAAAEIAGHDSRITLDRVTKWYGAVVGVNDVSLEIEPGITGLLGENGAGKSTLIRLLTGQLQPSAGRVLIDGLPVRTSTRARARVGYVPDIDGFWERSTGRDFVRSMARLSGLGARVAKRRAEEVLEVVGMRERASVRLGGCSKGMRQRIKIAQALIHDPPVLVLDEPLTGVDPPGRREMLALFERLRGEGRTLLVSSHILREIEAVTDRVALLSRGRLLASGTIPEIRGLLDRWPLTVRVRASDPRALARALVDCEAVVGTSLDGAESGELVLRVRAGDGFFEAFPGLVLDSGVRVERFEPVDESAEAVFRYLTSSDFDEEEEMRRA